MTHCTGYSLALVLLSSACSNAPAAREPTLENTATLADDRGQIERPCIPASIRTPVENARIQFRPGHPLPSVCVWQSQDDGAPPQPTCWSADSRGLVARLPVPPADHYTQATDDGIPWRVRSPDGRYQATIADRHVDIHDANTDALISHIPWWSDVYHDGISAAPIGGYFVADTLFILDHDAGPHADVIGFRVGSHRPVTVADEVYNGSVSVLDAHRIAFGAPGLESIAIYDTRSHQRRVYTRQVPPPEACTTEQHHSYMLEPSFECGVDASGGASPRCCEQLHASLGRYMSAEIGALPDGRLLIGMRGADIGEFEIFDPERQALTAGFSAVCKP